MDICSAKEAIIIYAENLRKKVAGIPDREQFNKMRVEDMKPMANLMYMKYVLSNSFSIQANTGEKVAYEHLIKMIDDIRLPNDDAKNSGDNNNNSVVDICIDDNYMENSRDNRDSGKSIESLIDVVHKQVPRKWSIF